MDTSAGFKLGVASYSLRSMTRTKAIAALKELDVKFINIKEFHSKIKVAPEEWVVARKEFEDAGIQILGGGNITFKTEEEAEMKLNFDYAKAMGFPLIVMAPTVKNLPIIEKYVKKYNIKAAIHNHGPEDKIFPTPQSVLKEVKNMDPRMGLCIDIGHTARAGVDILESIKEAGSRLHDMHVKDLREPMAKDEKVAKESQVSVGQGVLPVAKMFKLLKSIKYSGAVMLEYEINANDPLPGMKESFAYMRGILAGIA
jgi:sugar phosphate isomerase/epimerase